MNDPKRKNNSMNMSALLTNKVQIQLAEELPRFVSGYRQSQKRRSININKGLINQDVKNRSIHKILQSSIKQAIQIQESERLNSASKANMKTKKKIFRNKNTNNKIYMKRRKGSQSQNQNQNQHQNDNLKQHQNYNQHSNQQQQQNCSEGQRKSKRIHRQIRKHADKRQRQKICRKAFPQRIVNILYRQNIKNYNPYTTVLSQLQQTQLSIEQVNKIKKLCYIGIARNYFQGKKYAQLPKYSRVGVLIRTYMIDVMRGLLEQKISNQPHSAYVRINQTALSFNPYNRPKQLQQAITKKRYSEIISGANKLIQLQYDRYKKTNFQLTNNYTYSQLALYVIILLILIGFIVWSPANQPSLYAYSGLFVILLVSLGGMGIAWMECKHNLGKICPPNNLTSRILDSLKVYFKKVSDQALTWKVGTDFYWIQIQIQKMKKRKYQENNNK